MAENSSTSLVFTRTNDEGLLLLRNAATGETFTLEVSDELEQGILAAKQIKKDAYGTPLPQNEKALPISMIQSLIRAGHSPEEIQQEHGVSAALVRRFAGPVETEKKFAIAQFLDNLVPGDQTTSKITEIIRTTMATIGSDYEEIQWDASREGHNPWRIEAVYDVRGTQERAEWMFNPRDRSVVCVNTPAKRLLGEVSLSTSPVDQSLFSTDAVPIVTGSTPDDSATNNGAVSMKTGSFENVSMSSIHGENRLSTDAFNAIVSSDDNSAEVPSSPGSAQPESFEPHIKRNQSLDNSAAAEEKTADEEVQPRTVKKEQKNAHTSKRMRSSIPAWDDILFGSN